MAHGNNVSGKFFRPEVVYGNSVSTKLDNLAWTTSEVNPLLIEERVESERKKIISPFEKPTATSLGLPGVSDYLTILYSKHNKLSFFSRFVNCYAWYSLNRSHGFLIPLCYLRLHCFLLRNYSKWKEPPLNALSMWLKTINIVTIKTSF